MWDAGAVGPKNLNHLSLWGLFGEGVVEKAEGASLESYSGRGLRKGIGASTTEVLLSPGDDI